MPIKVECPGCSKTINAPDKYAGKSAKCPGCGSAISIPGDDFDAAISSVLAPTSTPVDEIDCPFCSEPIKRTAKKCKHCGEFLDKPSPSAISDSLPGVRTIEATAKKWKQMQLVAGVIGFVGVLVWLLGLGIYSKPVNPLMWIALAVLVVAVGVSSYARFQAWWHHG